MVWVVFSKSLKVILHLFVYAIVVLSFTCNYFSQTAAAHVGLQTEVYHFAIDKGLCVRSGSDTTLQLAGKVALLGAVQDEFAAVDTDHAETAIDWQTKTVATHRVAGYHQSASSTTYQSAMCEGWHDTATGEERDEFRYSVGSDC